MASVWHSQCGQFHDVICQPSIEFSHSSCTRAGGSYIHTAVACTRGPRSTLHIATSTSLELTFCILSCDSQCHACASQALREIVAPKLFALALSHKDMFVPYTWSGRCAESARLEGEVAVIQGVAESPMLSQRARSDCEQCVNQGSFAACCCYGFSKLHAISSQACP